MIKRRLEDIARAIHEHYLAEQRRTGAGSAAAMVSWEDLDEDLKQANRDQAADIETKLARIGCAITSLTPPFAFTDDEIELLARREHRRWLAQRRTARPHPSLVGWGELSESERDKDRQAVRNIPSVLAEVDLAVVRHRRVVP